MSPRHWIVALVLSTPAVSLAKPADLPAEIDVIFEDNIDQFFREEAVVATSPAVPCRVATGCPACREEPRPTNTVNAGRTERVDADRTRTAAHVNQARVSQFGMLMSNPLHWLTNRTRTTGPANDFFEEQEPPLNLPEAAPRLRQRMPTGESPKPLIDELLRLLEMFRTTQPLGTAPTGPDPF